MRAEDWVDVDSVLRAAQGRWPSILHALGVDPAYLRNKHGPCPLCGGKDRYRFDDRDGAGTWICSHCGAGTGPQLIEHLKGIGFIEAVKAVCNVLPMATQPAPQCPAGDVWERLRRIWRESAPVTCDDAVARYLEARRVWGPYPYPADIRCHPALGYYEDAKRIATYPAMVALVRGPDGKGRSLHVTYLDPKGGKARVNSARKLLAPTGRGGAIRLSSGTLEICVGEGIETTMAKTAHVTGAPGGWSCMNARGLESWIPPDDTQSVHIAGDNDANFVGQAAAYALAKRLAGMEISVQVHIPPHSGTDWADVRGVGDGRESH